MATTKEQILAYMKGLDLSTLQKLQKYSELLIIPDEDLLVNTTMSQMVEKAHSLADSLFPEWTDRSKSDFGEFLVELFALYSEKDFWYINAFANEGIFRKIRSYSNAFSKASSLGYQAAVAKGAYADFSVTFEAGDEVLYERGDLIVSIGGVKYSNDEEFTVAQSATDSTMQLTLREGVQYAEDINYNGYNIFLRRENVDVSSVQVIIDNILFSQVNNFGFSAADSTHFMVLPEEDGSCSIYFGSDGYGVQPSVGKSIRVMYRRCNGTGGNKLISAEVDVSESLPAREATSVVMVTDAVGGTDADSLTSIKEKAPLFFTTKNAAINEEVAQNILNSFSFIHKSDVSIVGRTVNYRIIPSSGDAEPSSVERTTLVDEFHPYIMAGYNPVYAVNSYKNLLTAIDASATMIYLDVIMSKGYNPATIEAAIRQIMEDLTNPLIKAEYGGGFSKTDADILMRSSVAGVQSVTFKALISGVESVIPDVQLNPTEIFQTVNQANVTVRVNVY